MSDLDLDKIQKIAKEIREDCLIKYKKRFESDLFGCCAIASGRLHKRLIEEGYNPIIVQTSHPKDNDCSHCYVVVGEYVVDITATQFGENESVCLFKFGKHKKKEQKKLWYWYSEFVEFYPNTNILKKEQKRNNWPVEQIYWSNKYLKQKSNG